MKRTFCFLAALLLTGCAARMANKQYYEVEQANAKQIVVTYNEDRVSLGVIGRVADEHCAKYDKTAVFSGNPRGERYVNGWISYDVSRTVAYRCE